MLYKALRTHSVQILTAIAIFVISLQPATTIAQTEQRPNFLVISIDDLKDIIGALEDEPGSFLATLYPDATKRSQIRQLLTPNIDRLAAQSVVFTDAHTIYPICNPSRIALWTGTRPLDTGLDSNSNANFRGSPTGGNIITMQQSLRNHGYFTTGLGKIFHTPRGTTSVDSELSWDIWINRLHGAKAPWSHSRYSAPTASWRFGASSHPITEQHDYLNADHVATLFEDGESTIQPAFTNADVTVALPSDNPFMIGLGIYLPHKPFVAAQEALDLFDVDDLALNADDLSAIYADLDDLSDGGLFYASTNNQGNSTGAFTQLLRRGLAKDGAGGDVAAWKHMVKHYLASMVVADRSVGRVLDALDNSIYANNTVVVLHSDHGYNLGEKNVLGKNTLWDDSTRSVLMFKVPGVVPAQIYETVSLQDIYPTVVSLAGATTPSYVSYQDLTPFFTDNERVSTKPILSIQGRVKAKRLAVITERYRYMKFFRAPSGTELYDRYTDPDETHNLVSDPQYQHVVSTLNNMMDQMVINTAVAPTILPVANQSDPQGTLIHMGINAWDIEGKPLQYSASNLPAGLTLNPSTGTIKGTLSTGGVYSTELIASSTSGQDSTQLTWTVTTPDTNPPTWTSPNIAVTHTNSTSISITWSGIDLPSDVQNYSLTISADNSTQSSFLSNETSYDFTNLEPDTQYTIAVQARDAIGNESTDGPSIQTASQIADTESPAWADGADITINATSADQITLSWPTASDNINVRFYHVAYSTDNGTATLSTSSPYITLANLAPATSYHIAVTAQDSQGNQFETPLNTIASTTASADQTPPQWSALAQISAPASSQTTLSLAWSGATDDVGIAIYRITLTHNNSVAAEHDTTASSTTIENLQPDTSYKVTVQALDAAGNSSVNGPLAFFNTQAQIPSAGLLVEQNGLMQQLPIESFSNQDNGPGHATLLSNGSTLQLSGNIWKKVALEYTLTANTIIEFDFQGMQRGEVHAIGLETDNKASSGYTFQLWGTQRFGRQNFKYSGQDTAPSLHFRIPVGQFLPKRKFTAMTFISDHDSQPINAKSQITNIRIYEEGSTPAVPDNAPPSWSNASLNSLQINANSALLRWSGATDNTAVVNYQITDSDSNVSYTNGETLNINQLTPETTYTFEVQAIDVAGNLSSGGPSLQLTTPPMPLNPGLRITTDAIEQLYSQTDLLSYGKQDKQGTATISTDGSTLTLQGNSWKYLLLPTPITTNTVLQFDFSSTAEGGLHGFAVETNIFINSSKTFKLFGTKRFGKRNFDTYSLNSGTTRYEIPIGQYTSGTHPYLVFINDHDVPNPTATSTFSNITMTNAARN